MLANPGRFHLSIFRDSLCWCYCKPDRNVISLLLPLRNCSERECLYPNDPCFRDRSSLLIIPLDGLLLDAAKLLHSKCRFESSDEGNPRKMLWSRPINRRKNFMPDTRSMYAHRDLEYSLKFQAQNSQMTKEPRSQAFHLQGKMSKAEIYPNRNNFISEGWLPNLLRCSGYSFFSHISNHHHPV